MNKPDKTTTIHRHGISPISYSEGGPFKPGTYWYHSHTRPVAEQVNRGLYAPFIVKAPKMINMTANHYAQRYAAGPCLRPAARIGH